MKAAFLTGPRTIDVRDVPEPALPEGGLVISTGACGICGSDLRRWREGPPKGATHLVQGHELAGTVVKACRRQSRFQEGDRVAIAPDIHCGECYYCRRGLFNLCTSLKLLGITPGLDGGFAERVAISGDLLRNGIIHRMPEGLSFEEGGMAETLSSVLACQEAANVSLGDTVVVIGAGPIGALMLVLARARGARTICLSSNPARRAGAAKFKPDHLPDPTAGDIVAEVKRLTGGIGADIVICANPVAATQTTAVQMVRRGGQVVLFGGLPKADPMTHLDGNLIHYGEVRVIGSFSYHPRFHEQALDLLARKVVDASQLVTHRHALTDVAAAFDLAQSGQGLKVMVLPNL